jgi:16S rRNA (cytidine1402-2'-O)-methyltransferase
MQNEGIESEKQQVKLEAALYVVATPIGNLGDISERALDMLRRADVIAAEDTRNSQSLLSHYGIKARLIAVHDHNEQQAAGGVVKLITEGKSVALVTDAGTPAISDPGARVVAAVHAANLKVVPIPGASAVVAAVSASGEGEAGFLFHGFLPAKAGERKRALAALYPLRYPIVLYESPHRIVESMADIAAVFGSTREVVVCREITKKFETIKRLPLVDAVAWLESDSNQQRGEFVLVLSKPNGDATLGAKATEAAILERTLRILLAELPVKQAVAMAVQLTDEKKNTIYELALKIRDESPDV